jgi:hypothetical protein
MEEIQIKDAVRNATDNPESRWPSREASNRLEPFCWPALRPKFKLQPASTIFTIGSCFARSIEKYLGALGFRLPTVQFFNQNRDQLAGTDISVLNRYTPAAIYQELKWVRGILDRDDQVRMEDIEPFLLDVGRGQVCDLGRLPFHELGTTPEQALCDRRLLYGLFRPAFDCDAVVITLGLIECWWDRQHQQYVEFSRHLARHPDRFAFRRLDYPTALDYVQQTVHILNRDRRVPILLTTSPVPLNRTFTADDVIVANMYSKSVLRAVAEVVRAGSDFVDYFPSYESVMLSRDKSVWMDDLIHVQPGFVSSIMLRVMRSYVAIDEPAVATADAMLQVIRCVTQEMWQEAKQAFDQLDIATVPLTPVEFYVSASELLARIGDKAAMLGLVARCERYLGGDYGLRIAKALEAVGATEQGAAGRKAALASAAGNKVALWNWVALLEMENRREDLEWLLQNAPGLLGNDIDGLWRLAQIHQNKGRLQDAEALYRTVIRLDPRHEDACLRLGYLLLDSDRRAEGLEMLERAAVLGCDNLYLHPLVSAYSDQGRGGEAKKLLERLIAANPDHEGLRTIAHRIG